MASAISSRPGFIDVADPPQKRQTSCLLVALKPAKAARAAAIALLSVIARADRQPLPRSASVAGIDHIEKRRA
jgi:hypothetical protein